MKPVLLDTGVVVALLDRTDAGHALCTRAMKHIHQPLVTCEAVVTECCYILRDIPGAAEDVLENVEQGIFLIQGQLRDRVGAIGAIMRKYRAIPASFADACLIHLADELNTGDILTLDSDFLHYRWRKTRPFNLLIPLG